MDKLTIKVPVYQCSLILIIDEKIEPIIEKYLKKLSIDVDEGTEYHGLVINPPSLDKYYVFYSKGSLTPNIITHEISHIVDCIFADRRIEEPDTEVRAYLTGYISEKVFDYILKKDLLINKWLNKKQKKVLPLPISPPDKNLSPDLVELNTNSKEENTQIKI